MVTQLCNVEPSTCDPVSRPPRVQGVFLWGQGRCDGRKSLLFQGASDEACYADGISKRRQRHGIHRRLSCFVILGGNAFQEWPASNVENMNKLSRRPHKHFCESAHRISTQNADTVLIDTPL